MDSDTTAMTAETKNLLDPTKTVHNESSSKGRWIISTIQAGVDSALFGCGMLFFHWRPPTSQSSPSCYDIVFHLNCTLATFGGLVFFMIPSHNQSVRCSTSKKAASICLSVYLASLLIAVVGVGSSGSALALNINPQHRASNRCKELLDHMTKFGKKKADCCLFHNKCGNISHVHPDELQIDCEDVKETYKMCFNKEMSFLNHREEALNQRIAFYGILTVLCILQCFFSILGASFTCTGLYECNKKQDAQEVSMMDSDATTISQDNLKDPSKVVYHQESPKTKCLGAMQASISFILVWLGVTFLYLRFPFDLPRVAEAQIVHDVYVGMRISHHCAVGIWGGMVFFITGMIGIFRSKTKYMASLYSSLCLGNLFIALIGVFWYWQAIDLHIISKQDASNTCNDPLTDMNYLFEMVICDANSRMPLYVAMFLFFGLECFLFFCGARCRCCGQCGRRKKQHTRKRNMTLSQPNSSRQIEISLCSSDNLQERFQDQTPRFRVLTDSAQPDMLNLPSPPIK